MLQDLCCRWGMPDVDLVSKFNSKLNRFVFKYKDPLEERAFPPLKLLHCLVHVIQIEGILVVVLALDWPDQYLHGNKYENLAIVFF